MKEETLLPHVENLVPGFVTLCLLATLVPVDFENPIKCPALAKILTEPVLIGILLSAAAYLVGVVVFSFSQLVVDTISKWTFRWILLWLFEWHNCWWKTPKEVNRIYFEVVKKSVHRDEVLRRRQRGRLIRTAAVPAVWLGLVFLHSFFWAIGACFFVVILYAYAEVAVYREAQLIQDAPVP